MMRSPGLPWTSPRPRRLGGLIIDWRDGAPASGFRVRGSLRGRRWRTLYATPRAGGARSYVYLPNLKTRSSSPGAERTVGGRRLAPPVVRVQPFDRDLLVQHRSARAARLVPALAASRANPVDADRDRERHALRSHQRGRRGRDDAGVVLDRADGGDRRPSLYLGGRRSAAGTARGRATRSVCDLGNRRVVLARAGRGDGGRARSSALSTREPLGPILIDAPAGARSPVSGDTALAERRQDRRREPHPRPGLGSVVRYVSTRRRSSCRRASLPASRRRRSTRASSHCVSPQAAASPRTHEIHDALGLASGALAFDLALRTSRNGGAHRGMSACAFLDRSIGEPAFDWAQGASRSAMVRRRVGDRRYPRRAHGDRAHTRDPLRTGAATRAPALHALVDSRRQRS